VVGVKVSISHPGHDPDGLHRAQRRVVQFAAADQVLNILPGRLKDVRHEVERLGVVALSGNAIRPPVRTASVQAQRLRSAISVERPDVSVT
jgi:hypothetical protein